MLYSKEEADNIKDNLSSLISKIEDKKLTELEPTREHILAAQKVIIEFVKDKKRKLYGGYALNLLVKSIKSEDAIYTSKDLPDMDIYSPDPLQDLIDICNLLEEQKFQYVSGREALHKETYTITVMGHVHCDLSYVPANIYNRMPFMEVDGYHVIHPHFMWIDYMRMFVDPLISGWRWEKAFKRFYLLQKHFPIRETKKKLDLLELKNTHPKLEEINRIIKNHVQDNPKIILFGFEVYNYYLDICECSTSIISKINSPYFEWISTEFIKDTDLLIEELKKIGKVSIKEYYPFFQFTDHMLEILVDDVVVAKIYDHMNKCLSCVKTPIGNIGSFQLNLMMCLINAMRMHVNENTNLKNMYFAMAYQMIQMKRKYLGEKHESIIGEHVFGDMNIHCIGSTQTPEMEKIESFKIKKAKGKQMVFKYTPSESKMTEKPNFIFANSSGNQVSNSKNLVFKDYSSTEKIEKTD